MPVLVGGDAGEAIIFAESGAAAGLDGDDQLIVFLDDISVADAVIGTDIILVP